MKDENPACDCAHAGDCDCALELQGLHKNFGELEVIRDLSLRLPRHQTIALLGPSGCGKSTVLNLISGIDTQYSGNILFSESGHESNAKAEGKSKGKAKHKNKSKRKTKAREAQELPHIGYMLQKDLLLPWRNIEQNVFLPQELHHLPTYSRSEVDELFALFGLEQFRKSYPYELSGGMRQRANLLRTYTLKSDLLLLDEPFGALDALTKQSLEYWFLDMLQQQPRSILLVTHDIREAILLASEVLVLSPRPCRVLARFDVRNFNGSDIELERKIFAKLNI